MNSLRQSMLIVLITLKRRRLVKSSLGLRNAREIIYFAWTHTSSKSLRFFVLVLFFTFQRKFRQTRVQCAASAA
jgi:hypothetical protein